MTTIDESPGIIKRYETTSAEFRWTLLDTFVPGNIYIHKGGDTGNIIVSAAGGRCTTADTSLSCITEDKEVGFGISNIDKDDASRYSISVRSGTAGTVTDTNGVLYVYRK